MSPTARLVRRLHFYAGVLVGPFLLVAAISGGIYALMPAAEKIVYRSVLHTDSAGPQTSLAEQVRAARESVPGLEVVSVTQPIERGDTTRVLFADPALPESVDREVFVDPVTARVLGSEPSYGGELPLRAWFSTFHRDLHLGEAGLLYSELAASWLWVIALAGVALWLAHVRKRLRATGRGNPLVVDGASKRRERTLNRHGVLGLWIAVALLFLSATGLTWSEFAGKNIGDLRTELSATTPQLTTSLSGDAPAGGGGHSGHGGAHVERPGGFDPVAGTDAALRLARSAGVGTDTAVTIRYPATPDEAFTVSEAPRPWLLTRDSAAVDPAAGTVVDVQRFADWPLAAKLSTWGVYLHMGLLFGWLNQLVLFVVAVALVIVIVRGYQLWWRRRRRGSRLPAPAPARGALRDLPVPAVLAIAALAAAIGWFLPLLGWPLLAFLALDVVLGLFRRRRDRRASVQRAGKVGEDSGGDVPPHALVGDGLPVDEVAR